MFLFVCDCAQTIGSLLDAFFVSFVNVAVFRSLRTFRVARLLRLMHGRAGVITLLNTLWLSIPALLNVAAMLALLFTLCASNYRRFAFITKQTSDRVSCSGAAAAAAAAALLRCSYAVLGVSVFGELPRGDALTEHNNFETCEKPSDQLLFGDLQPILKLVGLYRGDGNDDLGQDINRRRLAKSYVRMLSLLDR